LNYTRTDNQFKRSAHDIIGVRLRDAIGLGLAA